MQAWFHQSIETVLEKLGTSREVGLSELESVCRLEQHGKNQLDSHKGEHLFVRFFRQMQDPMILVLLAAAILSVAATGGEDWLDAGIIGLIVLVNAVISISQEDNAQRALEALSALSAPRARVLRGGKLSETETANLVPGDIIYLEAGDYVPADARLLSAVSLLADESAMTGESLPAEKQALEGLPEDTALGERRNMLLAATTITAGRGEAVVCATGMETEMGRIAGLLLGQENPQTPLQQRMTEISKVLSFVCLSVCAILFGVGLLQHRGLWDMLMTAVSLAVAAIPEGLCAIVTIVLSLGVSRMAKNHAIVKKLAAVETLGAASVICSDKTGTLTQNKMTVTELWPQDVQEDILSLGSLCSNATVTQARGGKMQFRGDPTEKALVERAYGAGIYKSVLERDMPRVSENPFDSTRKRMSTLHQLPRGGYRLVVKGAPEVVLARCIAIRTPMGPLPLSGNDKSRIRAVNGAMADKALRVLAVAYCDYEEKPSEILEEGLTFVGLFGMIDPPRPSAQKAVLDCYRAGITPVMITGDHKATAVAIAKDLAIYRQGDLAITGEELDFLPQEALEADIEKFRVFARVTPEHKMRIVKAWQARGHVAAMTGDGVNDAPALKAADIGCAMGISGTDVAKGAADMILTEDDFTAVVQAVEQGRGIYANIKKAIAYLLSCNIGEILTIFVATLLRFPVMPLSPVQLLWLNLVTDSLPALALGMEPVEADVMEQKPRAAEKPLFDRRFSLGLLWQGLMVGGLTLTAFLVGYYILGGAGAANTMAFATLTLSQLFHGYNVRSEERSLFQIGLLSNPAMNKAFLAGLALQMAVLLLPPLQAVFAVVPLDKTAWLWVFGLAMLPLVICETVKLCGRIYRRREEEGAQFLRLMAEGREKQGLV